MIDAMTTRRNRGAQAALLSLEADAVSARSSLSSYCQSSAVPIIASAQATNIAIGHGGYARP